MHNFRNKVMHLLFKYRKHIEKIFQLKNYDD